MGKRIFALLTAACMAAVMVLPAASARETEQTVTAAIGTGLGERPAAEVEFVWDDAWFDGRATDYCHGLAVASMVLSGAAYIGPEQSGGAGDTLEKLGFEEIVSYHYAGAGDGDRTAYTFAVRKLTGGKGEGARLVAIVLRGTGAAAEWASNLNVGGGSDHQGFSGARDELLANLEKYLEKLEPGGGDGLKLLVTGHSRGGAAANLAAAYLTCAGPVPAENIYAYTFAAPAVSVNGTAEGYGNIFNIVNEEDLVTQVPLAQWGYRRYGVDLTLPSRSNFGADYEERFQRMDRRYEELTGQPYAAYQDPAAVERITAALYRLVPSVEGMNMAMLSALLGGRYEDFSALVRQNGPAALLLGRAALEASAALTPLLRQEKDGIVSAHCMAGYYSWLTVCASTEEAEAMFERTGGGPAAPAGE